MDSAKDLARSAAEAPRMGGLALVKSGDEVLRQPRKQNGTENVEIFGEFLNDLWVIY